MEQTPSPVSSERQQQEETGEYFYYFSFGSNLLTERIHISNPSAQFVCSGILPDFLLTFGEVDGRWGGAAATVVEQKGDYVCGVVWKMSKEHSETLDDQEKGYRRLYVDVKILPASSERVQIANGFTATLSTIRCRTYQMIVGPNGLVEGKPSPHYKQIMLAGAKENKLPDTWYKRLEELEDNGYKGPIKVQVSILENQ